MRDVALHLHHPSRARSAAIGRGFAEVREALEGRDVPLTAQQLFIEMCGNGHRVGIATIYRALHVLEDAGHVHGFAGPDGTAFRVCSPQPHYHVICTTCGRVQERSTDVLTPWADVLVPHEFVAASLTIEVNGVCDRCDDAAGGR